jgi:type IV secretion system protein VirB5
LYDERSPFKIAESGSITIDKITVLRQSPQSFHVEWVETKRSLSGEIQGKTRWKAVLSYKIVPQNRPDTIENNPIGFFVQDLSWSLMQ